MTSSPFGGHDAGKSEDFTMYGDTDLVFVVSLIKHSNLATDIE